MKEKEKKLDDILSRLFINVLKTEEEAVNQMSDHNLSISEIHILNEIPDDRPKTMSVIAKGLRISVGALTIAMNKLVHKGYVKRFRGKTDKRTMKVILTSKGKDAYDTHQKFHKAMIAEAVSGLNKGEREVLLKSISKLDEYFQK